MKFKKRNFFFSELLPFSNLGIEIFYAKYLRQSQSSVTEIQYFYEIITRMKFCNQDISQTIKLGASIWSADRG